MNWWHKYRRHLGARFFQWARECAEQESAHHPAPAPSEASLVISSPFAEIHPTALLTTSAGIINELSQADRIRIGAHSIVEGRLIAYPVGGAVSIGEWCYVGQRSEIWSMKSITLGNRVCVSHDVNIHDTNSHSLDPDERHEHFRYYQESGNPRTWDHLPGVRAEAIVIEDDCWIGFGCAIFKGVRIGAGSVIAAKSIVTKDVPPGSFYRNMIQPVITPIAEKEVRAGC